MGEAVIGLGMTHQAVTEINNGEPLEVHFLAEGSPYDVYSSAVIKGKETDEDVMKVFDYLVNEITPKDKELYAPETIYKDRTFTKPNYPATIPYGDMSGISDISVKDSLLSKWKY